MPRLSVRIPTLNNYPGLVRALESILSQGFEDMDLIVVDNDSDDGSWPRIQALAIQHPRVKVVQNPQRGLAENWNYCIETATGDYVLVFHTDDVMLPGMLQKAVAFLDQHPDTGLVHANCYDVVESGKEYLRVTQLKPILRAGTEALTKLAAERNLACSTVVVRRECYIRLGLFLSGSPSPDYEMWARIASCYDIGHIGEPLVKVYHHMDSMGRAAISQLPPEEIERQWRMISEKIVSYLPPEGREEGVRESRQSMFHDLTTAANLAFDQRRWRRGHEFLVLACRYSAFPVWVYRYVRSILRMLNLTLTGHLS